MKTSKFKHKGLGDGHVAFSWIHPSSSSGTLGESSPKARKAAFPIDLLGTSMFNSDLISLRSYVCMRHEMCIEYSLRTRLILRFFDNRVASCILQPPFSINAVCPKPWK